MERMRLVMLGNQKFATITKEKAWTKEKNN
jgi:hypothetical protein